MAVRGGELAILQGAVQKYDFEQLALFGGLLLQKARIEGSGQFESPDAEFHELLVRDLVAAQAIADLVQLGQGLRHVVVESPQEEFCQAGVICR
ncbi:MAG: hypothetical protein FJZ01_24070 [Candidatus Sericytochromatia bacterium]|nr:hypothetical protein [Candidatus Tanganyikabacteria bacterium]